jgi:hypothetical protein
MLTFAYRLTQKKLIGASCRKLSSDTHMADEDRAALAELYGRVVGFGSEFDQSRAVGVRKEGRRIIFAVDTRAGRYAGHRCRNPGSYSVTIRIAIHEEYLPVERCRLPLLCTRLTPTTKMVPFGPLCVGTHAFEGVTRQYSPCWLVGRKPRLVGLPKFHPFGEMRACTVPDCEPCTS